MKLVFLLVSPECKYSDMLLGGGLGGFGGFSIGGVGGASGVLE